ncbi:LPXTG cell wall anchor domain-containing protein, partial [Secundilactobacillus pentosiphilus]|uniref:LPXTG cell wall anchor domain-containing protein n=1 Tax=Secundilactobacillus pentosiphilus TaxID=1714682 RepID=UPI0015E09D51
QPTQPTTPNQPSQPTQPTQPSQPSQPTQPTQPTQPSQPTQPTQPSEPATAVPPKQPSQPSTPGRTPKQVRVSTSTPDDSRAVSKRTVSAAKQNKVEKLPQTDESRNQASGVLAAGIASLLAIIGHVWKKRKS